MRIAVLALLALAVAAMASTARADGDPASDVLYFQDAYVPYPAPSKHASSVLLSSIPVSYTHLTLPTNREV